MHDMINIDQAKADIQELNSKFRQMSNEWESYDGDPYECAPIAEKELELVIEKADKYQGFIYTYDESHFDDSIYDDEWYKDDIFTKEDFDNINVTPDNYGKADIVAFELKEELVSYLKAEIEAFENDA